MYEAIKQSHEWAQDIPTDLVGKICLTVGSSCTIFQVITSWANTLVTFGNVFLVIGGAYLMCIKLFDSRRDRRKDDQSNDGDSS